MSQKNIKKAEVKEKIAQHQKQEKMLTTEVKYGKLRGDLKRKSRRHIPNKYRGN